MKAAEFVSSSGSRLKKTMYGLETDSNKTLFGLVNAQFRADSVLNNAGWYNEKGERLGYGDLNHNDIAKICVGLKPGEKFIVLGEFDSEWGLPKGIDRSAPGIDYVIQRSVWVILPATVIKPRSFDKHLPPSKETVGRLSYQKMSHEDMFLLIGYEKPGKKKEEKKPKIMKEVKDLFEPVLTVPVISSSSKTTQSATANPPPSFLQGGVKAAPKPLPATSPVAIPKLPSTGLKLPPLKKKTP
jgi:hypothetical protein